MARKGGLGTSQPAQVDEDLLSNLFGEEPKEQDTPRRVANKAGDKTQGKPGDAERVGKFFKIDRELAVKIKMYAVTNDMKDHQVVNEALRAFFADKKFMI